MQPNPESPVIFCATDCCWGNALTLCLVLGYTAVCEGAMLEVTPTSNHLKVLVYLLVLCVGPCTSLALSTNPACYLKCTVVNDEYEYMQDGDILIGGVMTLNLFARKSEIADEKRNIDCMQ
ncbi:hypothetical protein XELAEV_18004935mg [Xenopus laevis]|uniref:Uncharacterized protein n=1 Tax=Xenopus laevis TaxID=8355 RepID=A0A974DVX8_XENLA|nr:hypothetical protein XELAEV_18004935mg [Xenopus laevis]